MYRDEMDMHINNALKVSKLSNSKVIRLLGDLLSFWSGFYLKNIPESLTIPCIVYIIWIFFENDLQLKSMVGL